MSGLVGWGEMWKLYQVCPLRRRLSEKPWLCPLVTDDVSVTVATPLRRSVSCAAVRVIVWVWAAPALGAPLVYVNVPPVMAASVKVTGWVWGVAPATVESAVTSTHSGGVTRLQVVPPSIVLAIPAIPPPSEKAA